MEMEKSMVIVNDFEDSELYDDIILTKRINLHVTMDVTPILTLLAKS